MPAINEKQPFTSLPEPFSKIHAEDGEVWDEIPKGTAGYHDPGHFTVHVAYDPFTQYETKDKRDYNGDMRFFLTKDEVLKHEADTRLETRMKKGLPFAKRYHGWSPSLWQKIKAVVFRRFIDFELKRAPKNLLKLHYSTVKAENFEVRIDPQGALSDRLIKVGQSTRALWAESYWHHNSSLNGYHYSEDGHEKIIEGCVTSSSDRSTDRISMMRRYVDHLSKKTLSYTGRADSESKALEQIKFIFKNELYTTHKQGIAENGDGSYNLTYLINNLMSPVTGIGHFTFDEKKSILKEQKILKKLSEKPLTIHLYNRDYTIHLKPIYFSDPLNHVSMWEKVMTDSHSGKKVAKKINRSGYAFLLSLAKEKIEKTPDGREKELAQATVRILEEKGQKLLPEEALFNRAILAQFLNIPIVNHCRSSTDRTIVAVALGAVAFGWKKLELEFPRDDHGQIIPHLILQDNAAKELFAAHSLGGHQVTRISRGGEREDARTLGFTWNTISAAARMMPERYTKPNKDLIFKAKIITALAIGFILNLAFSPVIYILGGLANRTLFFNPFFIRPKGLPFAKRIFDYDSPYVGKRGEGRSLIKPKEMAKLDF